MRQHKYNAKKVICTAGHTHDSRKEARRCSELSKMQEEGTIEDLRVQVSFELIPSQKYKTMKSERPCKYIADFVYKKDGVTIIEDCKGVRVSDYIIKRKLLKERVCVDGEIIFLET